MNDLEYTALGSFVWAVLFTALVVPMVVYSGMPVWGAVAVELSPQAGWWGAYLLVRER